jgi:hypothetical protein
MLRQLIRQCREFPAKVALRRHGTLERTSLFIMRLATPGIDLAVGGNPAIENLAASH